MRQHENVPLQEVWSMPQHHHIFWSFVSDVFLIVEKIEMFDVRFLD